MIKRIFLVLVLTCITLLSTFAQLPDSDAWSKADSIVRSIVVPQFKNKTYNLTRFGAKGDGLTDCTQAFKMAIQECHKKGGGMVLVPKGKYLTGAIHLLSNVNLHLDEGAEILFSRDTKEYLPLVRTRFGGMDLMNYSPFIYAYKQKNIAVTGKGILNGQANDSTWWHWNGWGKGPKLQTKATNQLYKQAQNGVPVDQRIYGEGAFIRTNFVQPYQCENVLIEGITLINSPAWILHPVLCKNVSVINVNINSVGPNNDGLDPESCHGVHIKGCVFRTGDDCIAIKAGKDHDGRRLNVPCENIVIRDCRFADGHGAIGIGSEMTGGVRNVFAENCVMSSPELDRAIRLKTNTQRGGFIENVYVRNCVVGEVGGSVVDIDMFYYDAKRNGKHYTKIRNIEIENLVSKKSKYAIRIIGSDSIPVENILIRNCKFENVKSKNIIEGVKNIQILSDDATLRSVVPFPVGCAMSMKYIKDDTIYRKRFIEEFNSITAESAMKMRRILPQKDQYYFDDADYIVDFARQYGKRVHGHTLMWGKVPDWLKDFKGDSIAWENILRDYIHVVVGRYKGKIASWDVANEMIDDKGLVKKENIWVKNLGEDCIGRAFAYAHEADPDALLFYNDYGHEYSGARLNGVLDLVNSMIKKGIPVHGIGLQMHTRYNLGDEKWENAIRTVAKTGLLIHISELDISLNTKDANPDSLTPELAGKQKEKYGHIFKTYNSLPANQKFGITVWGISDNNTWIRGDKKRMDWPLLFDDNYEKKPAYFGVLEAFSK